MSEKINKLTLLPKKKIWRTASILLLITLLIVGAVVARTIHYNSHVVFEGSSMEPTIHDQQMLTLQIFKPNQTPLRGDIVEFRAPNDSHITVKRIVALPGEKITISDGHITIFNNTNMSGFNPDTYFSKPISTPGNLHDFIVPNGSYILIGDNRSNSEDSRYYGPVPLTDILAKVVH